MKFIGALFTSLLFIALQSSAQVPDKDGSLVKWLKLEEAMELVKSSPRPIIIDFYTDWCGWCKKMKRTTYGDPNIATYVNTNFYPVKFDGEGKDTIMFLGEKYFPDTDKPRSPHPLTVKLLNNKLMYPTTLFLNGFDVAKNEFRLNMIASGYLEPQKLEPILIFTLENAGRNATYDDFNKYFLKAFYDSASVENKKVNWQTPAHAFNGKTGSDKKTLVVLNTDWCTSCKVMKLTSFNDSILEEYLQKKFHLVDFNVEIPDTINYKGEYFKGAPGTGTFHPLAFKLSRNAPTIPALIVLDETYQVIDVIPSYIMPSFLNNIIRYYGDDAYKTKSWKDFMEEGK